MTLTIQEIIDKLSEFEPTATVRDYDNPEYEIDPEYFADGCKRFEKETGQLALFTPETTTREQNKLFKEGFRLGIIP